MPSRDLKICIHEWTPEQTTKIQGFYVALRGIWDKMVPWYQLEEPFSEAGAQRYRSNMKFGGDGWPAKTRLDDIARNVAFPSRSGFEGLYVRVVDPPAKSNPPKGVYLHFHGGGWTLGAADGEDEALYRIAKNTGYTVASVEYRLGPKHEYPAAIHDCVDAALFMLKNEATYGPLRIMGGESAGAHLAMSVTLALRHQGIDVRKQLDCLVLNYGCFDLSQTPSCRNHSDNLIIGSVDMLNFNKAFVPNENDLKIPYISPLFNPDFTKLPPAIFIVGEDDALYDDSLFAAIKWHMAGNEAELVVFPGSNHGFVRLGGPDAADGLATSEAFVQKHDRLASS